MNNRKSVAMLVSMVAMLTFFGLVTGLSAQRITPVTNAATPNLTPIQGECLTIQIGDTPNGIDSTPTVSNDWVAWIVGENDFQKVVAYTWDGRSTVKHDFGTNKNVRDVYTTDDYVVMVIFEEDPNTFEILSSEVQVWDGTQYRSLPISPTDNYDNTTSAYELYPIMIDIDNRLYFINGNQLQYYENGNISTLITDSSLTNARLFMGGSVIYWTQYDEISDTSTFYSWRWDTQVITSFRTTTGGAVPINGQSFANNVYYHWFYDPIYNGDSLYWQESNDLWVYDGSTTTQITTDAEEKIVFISNNFLTWITQARSMSLPLYNLFVYDVNGIIQLYEAQYLFDVRQLLAVSDNWVLYTANIDGNDSELMMYDGSSVHQLTDDNYGVFEIVVSGNKFLYTINELVEPYRRWLYFWDGERLLKVDVDATNDSPDGLALDGYRASWNSYESPVYGTGNVYAAICPPDVDTNNDTVFNAPVDAMFVLNRVGQAPIGDNAVADIDGDGDIDFADVRYVAQHLGGTIVVPTPEF